jgi:hypothetical protein
MAHEPDDDEAALHWAGDEVTGREGARLPREAAADAVDAPDEQAGPAGPPAHPGARALTGLFALLYLALTVGWILATGYTAAGSADLATQIAWQFGEFTAIVAAPLWFGSTVLLTAGEPAQRFGWLALGLGLLLPWPLLPLIVTGGAA